MCISVIICAVEYFPCLSTSHSVHAYFFVNLSAHVLYSYLNQVIFFLLVSKGFLYVKYIKRLLYFWQIFYLPVSSLCNILSLKFLWSNLWSISFVTTSTVLCLENPPLLSDLIFDILFYSLKKLIAAPPSYTHTF